MEGRRKAFISAWELPVPAGQSACLKAARGLILFSTAALLSHTTHPPANGISLCGTGMLGGRHVYGDAGKLFPETLTCPVQMWFKKRMLLAPGSTLGASTLVSDLDGQRPLRLAQPLHPTAVRVLSTTFSGLFNSRCPRAFLFLSHSPGLQISSGLALLPGQLYFLSGINTNCISVWISLYCFPV